MTFDQFRDMAFKGLVVECKTVQERRNILELFEESGFVIDDASRIHLLVAAEEDHNTRYMHPGCEPSSGCVVCFRDFARAKAKMEYAISYDDVQDLIMNTPPIDNRSDAEFASDFASLLR